MSFPVENFSRHGHSSTHKQTPHKHLVKHNNQTKFKCTHAFKDRKDVERVPLL